ncbi:hypothetical protein E2C01_008672 [Portunus trituberculatus]|uniref:Uncharacterized protein n=1 Tax=Portunus trituberculatus TaxID=210409 RepID=A0A5B7D2Z7_PORTR|nr:hypothetical protein [Portunus trituberculatus]
MIPAIHARLGVPTAAAAAAAAAREHTISKPQNKHLFTLRQWRRRPLPVFLLEAKGPCWAATRQVTTRDASDATFAKDLKIDAEVLLPSECQEVAVTVSGAEPDSDGVCVTDNIPRVVSKSMSGSSKIATKKVPLLLLAYTEPHSETQTKALPGGMKAPPSLQMA